MLNVLWKEVGVGTEVYIFDSQPRYASEKGLSDLEMTLDATR
jgi:hypothetical protein